MILLNCLLNRVGLFYIFIPVVFAIGSEISADQPSEKLGTATVSNPSELEVSGAVNDQGKYLVENRGLLNALYVAGGISRKGCPNRASIFAIHPNGKNVYRRVDVVDILKEKADDVWVPPNFNISIPRGYFGCLHEETFNEELAQYIEAKESTENQSFNKRYVEILLEAYGKLEKP